MQEAFSKLCRGFYLSYFGKVINSFCVCTDFTLKATLSGNTQSSRHPIRVGRVVVVGGAVAVHIDEVVGVGRIRGGGPPVGREAGL